MTTIDAIPDSAHPHPSTMVDAEPVSHKMGRLSSSVTFGPKSDIVCAPLIMSFVRSVIPEFEAANQKYAAQFNKGGLPLPPGRMVAVVACMDARLDPAKVLGLEEGDAHVIRNAGGRTIDAIRSLVISQQLLGTREIVIVHHTDCGMLTFSDVELKEKIRDDLKEDAEHIAFLPFGDLRKSVLDDIAIVKKNPLLLDVPITGYIYDVKTGKIEKVE